MQRCKVEREMPQWLKQLLCWHKYSIGEIDKKGQIRTQTCSKCGKIKRKVIVF